MSSAHYPAVDGRMSRRDFLKLMAAAGTVMTFAPFVDWGKFLPNKSTSVAEKVKIEIRGGPANVYDYPVNRSDVVIYPKTGDEVLNKEAFRTWQLVRLPLELGGGKSDVSAFRLYSMVCVHLWCLWNYVPGKKMIACPCHASTYDPFTGKSYAGPASLQAPPANALPRLDLEADSNGDLWILPPTWDLRKNGIVGYGRYVA